jgi:hypothetical protein
MPHHQRPITAEDGTADVAEVQYGLRRAGMCTRFLPMAGPSRQPAKTILCGRCSTHGLPLNRGSFNEELVAVLLPPTNLESPENRLQDPIRSQAIASRQPGLLAGVLGPNAKMKERPLVRHRSDFFLLFGTIKEKPRRPSHEDAGFILAGSVRHTEPQLAHSISVNFASYRTPLTRRKLLLSISGFDLIRPTTIYCFHALDELAQIALRLGL